MTQVQKEKLSLRKKFNKKKRELEREYERLRSWFTLWIGTALVIGMAIGKVAR